MTRDAAAVIRLDPADNVVVARVEIAPGTVVASEGVSAQSRIPAGHKLATAPIAAGEPVRKYGQIIGVATATIAPGAHVHGHNCAMHDFARDYAAATEARPTAYVPEAERATFEGYHRADGRVGTRNYVGVLTTVNCAATVARRIADHFRGAALEAYPNVDGVVALTHGTGCGMAADGRGMALLQRTLAGYARHPNFGGLVIVGLGCEVAELGRLSEREGLTPGPCRHLMTIQDTGGAAATVGAGIAAIEAMLPEVDRARRESAPASALVLGLECGGSDAYSGISANPALGAAADLLVRHGGTAILGETPEIYGAEHLLTRRAASPEVADKLIALIRWWETYTAANGGRMDNNPTPGNKAGGLTTILEKSLGAAAKGGTTRLVEVYDYAAPVTAPGFVFMDTPGYDPVSVTGMVAGGANVVCFTTGRGSVFGCKPVPSLKLATNSALYARMGDDMDVDCGRIVDGTAGVAEIGEEIFRLVLETASGRASRSEAFGFGDEEFVPWQVGAVM